MAAQAPETVLDPMVVLDLALVTKSRAVRAFTLVILLIVEDIVGAVVTNTFHLPSNVLSNAVRVSSETKQAVDSKILPVFNETANLLTVIV